jgi:hypothetical protein
MCLDMYRDYIYNKNYVCRIAKTTYSLEQREYRSYIHTGIYVEVINNNEVHDIYGHAHACILLIYFVGHMYY